MKLSDLFTNDDYPIVSLQDWLKRDMPAMAYDYQVSLSSFHIKPEKNPTNVIKKPFSFDLGDALSDSKGAQSEDVGKPFTLNIKTILDASLPEIGYSFTNTPAGSGFLEASLKELTPVQVVYWDTAENLINRVILEAYYSQLTTYFTLRLGYKSSSLTVVTRGFTYNFEEGCLTKPTLVGTLSQSSKEISRYSFNFYYERFSRVYDDDSVNSTIGKPNNKK